MDAFVNVVAADGHVLQAYEVMPSGVIRGGVVVLHEIFGLTDPVLASCHRFARDGYVALAPALHQRVAGRNHVFPDSPAGIEEGRRLRARLGWPEVTDLPLMDVDACVKRLSSHGRVSVLGYCWGGTLSFLAATRLQVASAVSYYGTEIPKFCARALKLDRPLLLHFAKVDPHLAEGGLEVIRKTYPEVPLYTYPGGHGFARLGSEAFHEYSDNLAHVRTLDWLTRGAMQQAGLSCRP